MNDLHLPIDFVIAWVDGSDPEWQKKKMAYAGTDVTDARVERYRDWELLRYWFRGVEAFTPWVNRVWFICDQPVPGWLNTRHPKLRVLAHQDYIPHQYLPTFSSHPIELNMHRIPGLADHFVYFNDDTFLLRPLKQSFFFRNGLPCDRALLNPVPTCDLKKDDPNSRVFTIPLNDAEYLNRDFSFRKCIREHPLKWLNLKYGSGFIRNLLLCVWPRFVGFDEPHLPQAYVKKSFEEAWVEDADILHATSSHRFRSDQDVNQWLIRHRQLAQGAFVPAKPIKKAYYNITSYDDQLLRTIGRLKIPMICLNDGGICDDDFERMKTGLTDMFETLLPQKSRFEV